MKLWGGRFRKQNDRLMDDFHSSISFDHRLYDQDIKGSIAHARMLGTVGIISVEEAQDIIAGLESIRADIETGQIEFKLEAEDIHMNIETILIERIGEVGKKLHTGRSRNDQVALDTRIYAKEQITIVQDQLLKLITALTNSAEKYSASIMPGYTHLQIAQPITLGHHLMAYTEMFKRDHERLADCLQRTDQMPLGSGALAGTTFPIDREMVARELGFARITENSMDSVADRDYIIELLSAASIIMVHLSRFCEEIILWANQEFAFIELDDRFSTGSSIMPQKKNPDVAELIRGKSGRVFGDLLAILSMMKGLPLTYNKDMQEDKEALFDGIDTVRQSLTIFTPMLESLTFDLDRMKAAAKKGFSNATDLADHLVKKGLNFRDAHHLVGALVGVCAEKGISLEQLSLTEMKKLAAADKLYADKFIDEDVYAELDLDNVVKKRATYGGTAPERIKEAIFRTRAWLTDKR